MLFYLIINFLNLVMKKFIKILLIINILNLLSKHFSNIFSKIEISNYHFSDKKV